MTTLSTLAANNAGFGNILKAIQSGSAYIDPKGRVLSKTELKPLPTYYASGAVFQVRDKAYSYDEYGNMVEVPREPLQLHKFEPAGDGKFSIPKMRNEKDGGYYSDVILNATKDGGNFTLEDKDTTATGKYFKTTKGTDYSNQQWAGMSRGLANITNAVQTGEATVDSKKSTETWDDGMGNAGSKEYYALRDGNGTEVGALFDVPGRPDLKYAKNVGNETAGGSHNVYLRVDPKSGSVAPIQDWSKQVTYNESQGKNFWSLVGENAKAAAPVFAMIFAPAAGQAIGAALMEAGVLTSASAAAASATTATQAAAASAAATATATAIGTGIANATAGILQGKPVDQAIGDAAISTAIQIGTPAAVGDIKNQIAQVTSNPAITNAVVGATVSAGTALLKGKNAVEAFEKGGTNALVNQIGIDIPGFDGMNATTKKVVTDAINAGISGKDFKLTPEYMVNTLISAANKTAKNTQTANNKFEATLGRSATEDELKQFATVETEEDLNNSFAAYMDKLGAETSTQQAANDEAERLRQAGLREQSDREAAEAAQVESDRLAREQADSEASARQAAIDEQNRLDEAERLRLAGLQENTDVDLNKVVAGADTVGGGINQDSVQAVTGADTVSGEAGKDVVNTLVDAGLHDDFDGDNATDEDAEQARRVAEFGKDLTGGGVQDLGEVNTNTDFYDENSTGMGAYKYDPTSGTYTYTSDDGSTLTLDADGNIVGSTEATDTSWTGLTDTATGKLKLPGLPDGKLPNVKPPVKEKTTTTGTGTTTTTTGTGNTAITTGSNTAVQTGGGLNIAALMAIMGGLGGNQQPQQPQIETYNPGKGFEYFDWESDPFAPKTKDKTNPTGQPKMAGGGSVDELLEILRRSGI